MSKRLRAYLDLVRLPNLFTAAADPLAGFLFAGGTRSQGTDVCLTVAASISLYAAGVVLNDVADIEIDRRERPHRPLPCGAIPRGTAIALALVLFAVGVAAAFAASVRTGLAASVIVGAIVAYDLVFKSTQLAPLAMGACRALNLVMGMTATGPLAINLPIVVVLAAHFVYVTSVTWFARTEASISDRRRLVASAGGVAAAISLVGLLFVVDPRTHGELILGIGVMVAAIGPPIATAVRRPDPRYVQGAVRAMVLSLIVIDACIATAARGWSVGAPILLLLIPATAASRWLRVT